MSFLPAGNAAPPLSLTAISSKRPINLQNRADKLMLLFHGYQTAVLAGRVIQGVRESYPDPNQLLIASVADLRSVPRLLQGAAKKIMDDAYKQAATYVPASEDPADHIIILPDWKGSVFTAYQVPKINGQVALVLIDERRRVQGSYLGDEPLQGALALLNGRAGSIGNLAQK